MDSSTEIGSCTPVHGQYRQQGGSGKLVTAHLLIGQSLVDKVPHGTSDLRLSADCGY